MKILIVDDHPIVRAGVKRALSSDSNFEVVGEAGDALAALELVALYWPDLVTLDMQMPGLSVEEFVEGAQRVHPSLKVLIISAFEDEATVNRLKKVRISGYLLKSEAHEQLCKAVQAIAGGAVYFSHQIALKLLSDEQDVQIEKLLTVREREVLTRVGDGTVNQKIADELFLAEQTVRNCLTVIYRKISVTCRSEAVVWARRRGLYSR